MRFVLLLVCATLSAQTAVEKEQALGTQLAAEYRRQSRTIDSASVNAYLDELGQRIAAHAPATGFNYTFELTDDGRTWIHEAAAFPGGPVFVPAGLILAAADEDELAAMLAYAIAHIATRRVTRQITRGQGVDKAGAPLIFMGGWAGYAVGSQYNAVPIALRSAQRESELESDQAAVRMLSAAGYDPQALARYIERVQPADAPSGNGMAPYPDKDQRLAALRPAIRQLPSVTSPAHPGFDEIRREVMRLTAGARHRSEGKAESIRDATVRERLPFRFV
jgi:predicted Zn-dependent protease